jgi:hypothetical protein
MNEYRVLVPYVGNYLDTLLTMLHWTKEYCISYRTNNYCRINGNHYYRFYFEKESDATLFTLRWL